MAITKWIADPTHSEIGFKVKHMMFTNVSGKFGKFTAEVSAEDDNFDNANFEFSGEIASVSTGNADRDTHLRSPDFFNADETPTITFSLTAFTKTNGNQYDLIGDLTLRGITKPITLKAEFGGVMKDPFGNVKAAFSFNGKVSRKEWGLTWNAALETGGVLVSDEVRLAIELQFIKQ